MSDATHELLPFNATTFVRDVLKSLNFDDVLDPGVDLIREIKWPEPPARFLPALLQEHGLSQFSRFRTDALALYHEGRELNRVKGTKRAVRIVAEWLGFDDIEIRTLEYQGVHFPEFEVGLGKYPATAQVLCDLLDAVNRVKPLRSRFRRVWHGFDARIFMLSKSQWGDLLSDYSGVHSTDIGICTARHLCNHDLRISLRVHDREWVEEDNEVGESEIRRVLDREEIPDDINFPRMSNDFNGGFYPVGFGAVGERERYGDNSGFRFDGNREWLNISWINDEWTQNSFGLVGEAEILTVVPPPGAGTDSGDLEGTDDGGYVALG